MGLAEDGGVAVRTDSDVPRRMRGGGCMRMRDDDDGVCESSNPIHHPPHPTHTHAPPRGDST